MSAISDHTRFMGYKRDMTQIMSMYFPQADKRDLDAAIDASIKKRFKNSKVRVHNSYKKTNDYMTLLALTDYIMDKEPITTAYGVLFKRHGTVPNPMIKVIQLFLDQRSKDKKMMFNYPKGSEMFERYNLLQALDKIDANGIYGLLGLVVSLLYNGYVSPAITAQGRSLVSSAAMLFEMFLANNVKFGSLEQVMQFINNICNERPKRKFNDRDILDTDVPVEQVFGNIILTCGFRWFPTEDEMDVIWRVLNNLRQDDLNRIYYKNNLYEFMSNKVMSKMLVQILTDLNEPYLNPAKPPESIRPQMDVFTELTMEYVYYGYQIIDRIDRMQNMTKSVCVISDTDSTIISLDAWYRFVLGMVEDKPLKVKRQALKPIEDVKIDEFGDFDPPMYMVEDLPPEEGFDFFEDEIIEMQRAIEPLEIIPQDNLRYSIINILAYVLDKAINAYMIEYTKLTHSYRGDAECKIIMKNEFTFRRALLTMVKKAYATIQEVQEGNMVDKNNMLDVKGIACMAKSSMSDATRNALKKILYEDILMSPEIDQLKVIEHLSVLEKKIYDDLRGPSKKYYKPMSSKDISSYAKPMQDQGIKSMIAWNEISCMNMPFDLDNRNSFDLIKVDINMNNIEDIKETHPEQYNACRNLMLTNQSYAGTINAIAIPKDITAPEWIRHYADYITIVNDNINGFPLESIGINRLENDNVVFSNLLKL